MIIRKVTKIGMSEQLNSEEYLYENGKDIRLYYKELSTGIWFTAEYNHCSRVNDDIVFEICDDSGNIITTDSNMYSKKE